MFVYTESRSACPESRPSIPRSFGRSRPRRKESSPILADLSPLSDLLPPFFSPLTTVHYCFKSFSCNIYEPPHKCCKQKTYSRLTVRLNPLDATLTKNTGGAFLGFNIPTFNLQTFQRLCLTPPSPIFRTLFQVPYPVSPLFATLTKTAGVCTNNSHSGIPNPSTFQPSNLQTFNLPEGQ